MGWLMLNSFDGFGSKTFTRLHAQYGDGTRAAQVDRKTLARLGHPAHVIDRFVEHRKTFDPGSAIARMDAEGIAFVLRTDETYPRLLAEIADPPFALFIRGTPLTDDRLPIAIVGTRACTMYGRRVASLLGEAFARTGACVISGLALGIDAIAHAAALDAGGACVAVLGTGCDDASLYPRTNIGLAHRILNEGGSIISEFPPGTGSNKFHFPLRNRIISGLAKIVVVVEADERSGSLITAHQALEQNREVFAVPGPITSRQSTGTNRLIRDGATPCLGPEDVLSDLPPRPLIRIADLTDPERRVLNALNEPLALDELARRLDLTPSALLPLVSGLELKNAISPMGGQMIAKNGHIH